VAYKDIFHHSVRLIKDSLQV